MPKVLTNQTPIYRNVSNTIPTTKNVSINTNEFLFYSNNPENVSMTDTADKGYFLYKDTVTGSGQVYTWHCNNTGVAVNSTLLVYNHNSFAINIDVGNNGLTNGIWNDSYAWKSYFDGYNTKKITIPAGGYWNLFEQKISNGNPWGVIARLSIKNSAGAAASAQLFDAIYVDSMLSGNGKNYAKAQSSPLQRGKGAGFYATLSCTLELTAATGNGVRVNFGSYSPSTSYSSFQGNECSTLVDASGAAGGKLFGAFGQQMCISLTISNKTNASRKFRIYLGSASGGHYPVFSYAGTNISYNNPIANNLNFYDIIETDAIAHNSSQLITFFAALPAGTNTPYSFGVRPM